MINYYRLKHIKMIMKYNHNIIRKSQIIKELPKYFNGYFNLICK